jgi:hypothetical protein
MTLHALTTKSTETPPPRDPLRQLADAIEYHAALSAALEENQASQNRAEDAVWAARSSLSAAAEAVEQASRLRRLVLRPLNFTTTAASAASLSGASTNPRNWPRFLIERHSAVFLCSPVNWLEFRSLN